MYSAWRVPKDRLSALRSEDVEQYLTDRDWNRESVAGGETAVVYRYPSLADAEVVVPRRREFVDYAQRMADVVQMLAVVEERSDWEVLQDLAQPAFSIIGEVGRHLREEGVSRQQQVQGHVVSLRGETTILDGFEGTIIIKGPIAGGMARIQVTLSRRDYDQACNAHRDGRAVAVNGELHREPKLFHLSQPRDFKVLAEPENTAGML